MGRDLRIIFSVVYFLKFHQEELIMLYKHKSECYVLKKDNGNYFSQY